MLFSISNNSLVKKIAGRTFQYSKIEDGILSNPLGISNVGQASIATVERAVCDRIYLSSNYYFDNLRVLSSEKLFAISKIYNKRVQEEVGSLIKGMDKK